MLFRTNAGELIEIIKYNFANDKLYYEKIMKINKQLSFAKLEKTSDEKNN